MQQVPSRYLAPDAVKSMKHGNQDFIHGLFRCGELKKSDPHMNSLQSELV